MDAILFILLGAVFAFGTVWARGRYADFLAQNPRTMPKRARGQFDIRTHLNGPIQCEGIIYGPTGRVLALRGGV